MDSTYLLAEFLACASACGDAATAIQRGVERAAEAIDADIGALVHHDRIVAGLGVAGEREIERALCALTPAATIVDAGDFGPCSGISVVLDTPADARLVIARFGGAPFRAEERGLIRAMGRVLSLTLGLLESLESERALRIESQRHAAENARLAASLERRRRMLEAASEIERAISRRAPLQDVLDSVTAAAYDLLDADAASLWLRDPDDPDHMLLLASCGLAEEVRDEVRRMPVGEGVGGRAVSENRLVVMNDYASADAAMAAVARSGIMAAMAAPVHENGDLVGSLGVGSRTPGHAYCAEQQEILIAFAEHASLALTDAQAVERMNQAMHDPLTGLPNRTLLLDRIQAATSGASPVLLFVDLDRFKGVNDTFGHSYGDRLLIDVAERLRTRLRATDTLARLGGDEFVVLLESGATAHTAVEIAARMLAALRAPFILDGRELHIGASIGIATGRGGPAELVARADLAMYHAKRGGGGRYAIYTTTMRRSDPSTTELLPDRGLDALDPLRQ